MSEVTVVGLGAMGAAIASAFLNAGRATTGWNRSEDKMLALRQSGARCADDPGSAVSASDVVIVCIDEEERGIETNACIDEAVDDIALFKNVVDC